MRNSNGPACVHHPEIGGVAQCVTCHEVLCSGCSTRIRGRNLCARCVAAQLASAPSEQDRPAGPLLQLAVGLGAVGAFGGLVAVFLGLFAAAHGLG